MPHYKNTYRTNSEVNSNAMTMTSDNRDPDWCSRRTRLEKCTSWSLCFTVLLIIGISIVLALYLTTDILELIKHPTSKCETEICLETATELLRSVKEEIDPCDDFYEFACGKTKKDPKSPNIFNEYELSYLQKLQKTLESPSQSKEAKIIKVAKIYYSSCMNTTGTEEDDFKNMLTFLGTYGGWPLIDGEYWSSNMTYPMAMQMNKYSGLSTDYLLKISLRKDFHNTSKDVIYIEPPTRTTSGLLSNKLQGEYLNYIMKFVIFFGAPDSNDTRLAVEDILDLENRVADQCDTVDPAPSPLNISNNMKRMKMRELRHQLPSIRWVNHVKDVTGIKKIVKNQEAIVTNPEYFEFFALLLKNTTQRNLLNFLMWKVVLETLPYFPQLFEKIQILQAKYERNEKVTHVSRSDLCTKATLRDLPHVHDFLLPERSSIQSYYFEPMEVISFISSAFEEGLDNSYGMDNITSEVAKEKLLNLKYYIGTNKDTVDSIYDQMELPVNETYFNTYRSLSIYKERQMILLMKTNNFSTRIFEGGDSTKAFYSESGDFVYFPLESVSRLFKRNRPNYIQFSSLGFITAFLTFQITDQKGKQFDDKGVQRNWWTEKSEENFNRKISCYFEEAKNLTNNKQNADEVKWGFFNILEGVRQSYISYQNWKKKYTNEQELVGLKYCPNQLFWLSVAQVMCADDENNIVDKDPSWDLLQIKQRVNIPLRNLERFSKDWKCCRDDYMYFNDQC